MIGKEFLTEGLHVIDQSWLVTKQRHGAATVVDKDARESHDDVVLYGIVDCGTMRQQPRRDG